MSLASRACLATYGLAALLTGLSARLYHIAIHEHDHYAELARDTYKHRVEIPARRGSILAANGTVLARNEPLKNIIADDSLLFEWDNKAKKPKRNDRAKAAKILATGLKKTPGEILALIKPGDRYIVLEKKISEDLASALLSQLDAAKIKGIRFEQDFERIYPAGNFLSHVIGFHGWETRNDPANPKDKGSFKGIEGIEYSMDNWLAGQPGWRYFEKDGRGREIAAVTGEGRLPRHGADVQLTIDPGVQQIVESEIEEAFRRLKPKKATVIVMDPNTGAILALTNRPTFDPNHPGSSDAASRFNHAIASIYEPGSTFKMVSAAGSLNRGLAGLHEKIFCRNGTWVYPGGKITDHHPYGELTVEDIIAKSSNIGAVILAKRMGERPFYEFARSFGFGSRTSILLPGESAGILHPLKNWGPGTMYHVPFGHEVAATPLQVISATCAIANGGKLMLPQIVQSIRAADGAMLAEYPPQEVRRVIRPEIARQISTALEKVTSRIGTAIHARVPGFRVAGKTGTTQIFDKETGRYSKEDHTVSFVGFLPAGNPRFCCLVMIEDSAVINGRMDTGGQVAAPLFSKIAQRTARQLGLEPDPVLLIEETEFRKALAREGRL